MPGVATLAESNFAQIDGFDNAVELHGVAVGESLPWFLWSGEVRESRGVLRSQGKSGNFMTVARKMSIILFSVYILALKCDICDVRF